MNKYIATSLCLAIVSLSACGSVTKNDSAATKESVPETAGLNEAQKAYSAANDRMHSGMGIIDADADTAFIQGMIPHHQGAVDMANIILEHGDDEEAKDLARTIIKAQEEEIAWMKNWLSKRGLEPIKATEEVDHSAMGH